MKKLIVAAVSLDGLIAHGPDDKTISWTSDQDKAWLKKITSQAGVVIMGRHTFEYTLSGRPWLDCETIVLTHSPQPSAVPPRTIFTAEEPTPILERLEKQGYSEVVIFGGAQIFALFLQAGLVDSMHLTVAPVILKKGISFPYQAMVGSAELVSAKPLAFGESLLELKITA